MGRRAQAVEVDPNVEAGAPPEEAGGAGSASLFDASGDARVRVFRRDDRTQKMVTHGFFPPEVSEEDVSKAFGGGYYRAQLVMPDPASGLTKIKQSRDFQIPGAYRPPSHINSIEDVSKNGGSASSPAAAIAATAGMVPSGGGDLMEVLKAGIINTLLDMMKTNRETRAPVGPDPMLLKLMEQQAATQQKMMEFMLTLATKDTGDSRKEILATLAQMKELVAPPAVATGDPMAMFNTMLETFTRMREVADDINPKATTGSDPLMDSIPKLVEVVAEQHAMNKQQRVATRPVPGPAGGVAQMPVVGTIQPADPNPPTIWQQILRNHGPRLLASAVAKHDADVIAGTAILFAPPHVREALALFFHRDSNEVAGDIQTEIPAMADHREWLDEFIEAAQARLFPDEFSDEGEEDDAEDGDGDKSGR